MSFTLTVGYTGDVRGRVDAVDGWLGSCPPDDSNTSDYFEECLGGMARRATAIQHLRNSSDNVLLLDAGDVFQGSLYFTYYLGTAQRLFMNLMEYDVMNIGTHEFDYGTTVL